MLTFKQLRDQVLSWLDEANDTDGTATNVNYALNASHRQRCQQDRWSFMLSPQLSLSLVSGQSRYALDPTFGRPLWFYHVDNSCFLQEVPQRELESFSTFSTATQGQEFSFAGLWPVKFQPTSASVLTIVSSLSSDTGVARNVLVTGLSTAGGIDTDTITPNGTTPVSSTVAFTEILSLRLVGNWGGTCTVTSNAGAVTNVELLGGEIARQHPVVQLLWTPSGTGTVNYRFFVLPRVMFHDDDIPQIPFPHSEILALDALLKLLAYDGQTESGRLSLLIEERDRIELQLRQTFLEGQSTGARVRYVRTVDDGTTYL